MWEAAPAAECASPLWEAAPAAEWVCSYGEHSRAGARSHLGQPLLSLSDHSRAGARSHLETAFAELEQAFASRGSLPLGNSLC